MGCALSENPDMAHKLIRRVALAVAVLTVLPPAAQAQSLDPRKPAPLGRGVNKGNIDALEGTHYYYFFAGPGHIDVDMAFKESGVFGAPLRQSLSFDFYDEKGQLMSHYVVLSLDKLERVHADGDFDARQKLILAVVPQPAAVRLGGYYEITITGAAAFEGTAPSNVVPKSSEPLVRPAQPK
jgi:hypothetical protein